MWTGLPIDVVLFTENWIATGLTARGRPKFSEAFNLPMLDSGVGVGVGVGVGETVGDGVGAGDVACDDSPPQLERRVRYSAGNKQLDLIQSIPIRIKIDYQTRISRSIY